MGAPSSEGDTRGDSDDDFVHATPQERAEVLTLSSVSRYMVLRANIHLP